MQIVYNALQTPDGTVIQSKHRHDCVFYEDQKNGKRYMIDGGTDYVHRSNHGDETTITLTMADPIEKIRELFRWGRNYDENMKRLPATEWVLLKELNDDHLDALCTGSFSPGWITLLFIREKQYRNLTIEEFDKKAIVKFNGGNGAILCENCSVIIKTGPEMSDTELKFLKGEIKHIPTQYCKNCTKK